MNENKYQFLRGLLYGILFAAFILIGFVLFPTDNRISEDMLEEIHRNGEYFEHRRNK